MLARFSGAKNVDGCTVPAMVPKKRSVCALVVAQGGEQLLHLGRRRLQPRELERDLVARRRRPRCAAARSPPAPRRAARARRSPPSIASASSSASRKASVMPCASDRVLVVAGVADQRPARAVGPAEEVGQVGRCRGSARRGVPARTRSARPGASSSARRKWPSMSARTRGNSACGQKTIVTTSARRWSGAATIIRSGRG